MLTEKQKEHICELLSTMDHKDVQSLSNTITNRLITPETLKDAIDAILLYTENLSSFFSRKKITKEVIFRYLHSKKVERLNPSMDKNSLLVMLLLCWGENGNPTSSNPTSRSSNLEPTINLEPATHSSYTSVNDMTEMSLAFADWFYKLMNQQVFSSSTDSETQKFGAQHFWPDCKVKVTLLSIEKQVIEMREGADEVAALLTKVCTHFKLFFNPNLSPEGTRGVSEKHGAVMVLVCGTLHQENICIGFFDQRFLLLRDPLMDNNWRIRTSEMILQKGAAPSILTLDSERPKIPMIKN